MRKPDAERQMALYSFLLGRKDWTSQEEVCGIYGMSGGDFHNSSARRILSQDIQDINADPAFEKIIIHSNKGIKIATQEEMEDFLQKHFTELSERFRRAKIMAAKAGADGQLRFGRPAVEAFINRNIEGDRRL